MESQPQNPEFRNNHENFHPCIINLLYTNEFFHLSGLKQGAFISIPCQIEFLTQEQFKNSSWNWARILDLFKNICTWTVQEHKLGTVQELF